jgi:hypothetical protein
MRESQITSIALPSSLGYRATLHRLQFSETEMHGNYQSALRDYLLDHHCPVDAWPANGVDKLLRSLQRGESLLQVMDGKVTRVTTVIGVDVYACLSGELWRLSEDRQEYVDSSRFRVRRRNSFASITEKQFLWEDDKTTLKRAFQEELGIETPYDTPFLNHEQLSVPARELPGLDLLFHFHHYQVELHAQDVRREGYKEVKANRVTYFSWVPTSRFETQANQKR